MSPVRNACLGIQKITAHACCPLLAKETVLGPMSLKERGDRRRPRIANLVQFAVTGNCSVAEAIARAHSLLDFRSGLHQIVFRRAALQSPG